MDGKWASRLPDTLAGMAQEYIKESIYLALRAGAVVPRVTSFPASIS